MLPSPIRILLVEDHAMMRDGLRSLLRKEENIRIVGEAQTGKQAVEYSKKLNPHLILLDIGIPDLNGIDATRIIHKSHPNIRIIGLSIHVDRSLVREMLKAGACGYVPKECAYQEVIKAIHAAMNGKLYLSPAVSGGLEDGFLHDQTHSPESTVFSAISKRERQVLQLIAEGHGNREIALKLGISIRTVEAHRRNIMDKLELHSVADLTKYAIRSGLTPLG